MRVLGERGRRLTERHHLAMPGDIKSLHLAASYVDASETNFLAGVKTGK